MLFDEAVYKTLTPIFGERNVYSSLTSDTLPKDKNDYVIPFALFQSLGGDKYHSFERIYDIEKDNYHLELEVYAPRMSTARQLSLKARMALLKSPYFLAIHQYENMNDRTEWMNKIYGCRQDFSVWVANDVRDYDFPQPKP